MRYLYNHVTYRGGSSVKLSCVPVLAVENKAWQKWFGDPLDISRTQKREKQSYLLLFAALAIDCYSNRNIRGPLDAPLDAPLNPFLAHGRDS